MLGKVTNLKVAKVGARCELCICKMSLIAPCKFDTTGDFFCSQDSTTIGCISHWSRHLWGGRDGTTAGVPANMKKIRILVV